MTREMSADKLLHDTMSPSLSVGMVRRIVNQALEAGPVKIIDCALNTRHGSSGGPLLDEGGFVIGVVLSGAHPPGIDEVQGALAGSELDKFLVKCKISFQRTNSGNP
jgi:S1-C subfamily serine protease